MNTTLHTISLLWQTIAAILTLLSIIWAIKQLPMKALLNEPRLQHLLFGAIAVLMLTWTFRAGLSEGLSIHFLGMTTLTLMFGWDLAILAGAVSVLGITLIGVESWSMLSINLLTLVVIPASLCISILRYVERRFPPNFFVYLFLVAFIGGGLTSASAGLSLALILGLDGVHPWNTIFTEYIRYLPLIMFPEGLINGILMTAMMVFHPDWIRTFDARKYIDEQ